MALHTGDICRFTQSEMNALASSQILELKVQGMQLTAQKAAGSVPELIKVKSHSGIELKVLDIEDGIWTMEVVKEAGPS